MQAEKRCPSLGPWLLGAGCTRPGAYPLRPGPPEASAGGQLGALGRPGSLGGSLLPAACTEASARDRRSRASLLTPGVQDHRVAGGGDRSGRAGRQGSQCRPRTHLWSHVHTTRTPPTLLGWRHTLTHSHGHRVNPSLLLLCRGGAPGTVTPRRRRTAPSP